MTVPRPRTQKRRKPSKYSSKSILLQPFWSLLYWEGGILRVPEADACLRPATGVDEVWTKVLWLVIVSCRPSSGPVVSAEGAGHLPAGRCRRPGCGGRGHPSRASLRAAAAQALATKGPNHHTSIGVLHSGSKAKDKADSRN